MPIATKNRETIEETILEDIKEIEHVLFFGTVDELTELHKKMDGKYSAYIPQWFGSTECYHKDYGFVYEYLKQEELKHNLTLFKARLEGYLCGFPQDASATSTVNSVNVNVNNSNEVTFNITFEQARQIIEDMPGLTDADSEEIKEKINELEDISKEDTTKKKKWEKVKPIIAFALDKSADVAIMIMSLVMQMKLGK